MKAIVIFFIISGCLFITETFSQIPVFGPIHPLVNYGRIREDINLDTLRTFRGVYHERGDDQISYGTTIYTRSEDKLTDTVFIMAGGLIRWDLYRYNEKNQLLYWREFAPQYPLMYYGSDDYEYDQVGRLIKITAKYNRPMGSPPEDTVRVITYDYSTVISTPKGYIFNNVEYELDNCGRVVHEKFLVRDDVFGEFDEKKYRLGDNYYSYTDSSYIMWHYWTGFLNKTTFILNERGNTKLQLGYSSSDGINWRLYERIEMEYVYSTNSGTPNNNSLAGRTNTTVYAHDRAIHISTENAAIVQIFDVTGRLIRQHPVLEGVTQISTPSSGFYIVKVGHDSFKISVR